MWKRIETYIERHREELDLDTPSPMLWQRIERELAPTPTLWERWAPILKVAAAVVFALSVAFWWMQDHSLVQSSQADLSTLTTTTDWHQQDQSFETEAKFLLDSLKEFSPEEYPSMEIAMGQIEAIDGQVQALHQQLEEEGYEVEAVDSLYRAHEERIIILQELLNQLRKANP